MPFRNRIFSIQSRADFKATALDIFRYQASRNGLYREYIELLGKNPAQIRRLEDIPFLPICFFKTHSLNCSPDKFEAVFTSSGTAGEPSRHYVANLGVYKESFQRGFKYFYGPIENYHVLALLPSYLEREGSSLIYMIENFIRESRSQASGFFLYDHEKLSTLLQSPELAKKKILLWGVSFALLDFAERYPLGLSNTLVMETGGMKGRRKEVPRFELHERLKKAFSLDNIHSEYGMTELLSQAYSKGEGIFSSPPWMQILIRDLQDPFNYLSHKKTGAINVIDLANYQSCAFIATDDLGMSFEDHTFSVLGRSDHSELRGCNLLLS